MAGIFQGDIIIKTAIDLGIEDMRKNSWLIDHMLIDLKTNVYLSTKYGEKQIDACKEWFANNKIDVYMRPRDDRDILPCVTIEMGPSNEKIDMKSMADQSPDDVILLPTKIGKPIPYIVKPFVPTSYNKSTGDVGVPEEIDLGGVVAGMILVNPADGTGYVILEVSPNVVSIEPNQNVASSQFGILPKFQYYKARIEHSFFDETYHIGCHTHGDIQTTLWLWAIVKYSILRYRESLLEANGFAESAVSSGEPDLNREWTTNGGEKAYSRFLTLKGQTENTWIKSPRRFIESVALKKNLGKCKGYTGGITIISNLNTPNYFNNSQEPWTTVEDPEDPEDE